MMRFKFVLLAGALVLALPMAAHAQNRLFGSRCGGGIGGRGCGGPNAIGGRVNAFFGAIGDSIANSPGPVWPERDNRGGFGFFQPPFQASPWYLYWPYDQHFQLPAPINSPYFAPQAYGHPGMHGHGPEAGHHPMPPAPKK
jgi:hypothetical protein